MEIYTELSTLKTKVVAENGEVASVLMKAFDTQDALCLVVCENGLVAQVTNGRLERVQ